MSRPLTRRQAIRIAAVAAGLPIAVAAMRVAAPQPRFHSWEGEALGATASLTLWTANEREARSTIDRMLAEVRRLEGIFSLFRADSELSRLNAAGVLDAPSAELLAVLDESRRIAEASDGAFDPTVQPLWDLYAAHFQQHPDASDGPADDAVTAARALVDYRRIEMSPRRVRFGAAGMKVTLNGIAQGYITDRVAEILRNEGFDNVFVELGEVRALGSHPDGRPWQLGLVSARPPHAVDAGIAIADEAVSVSGGYGTTFDAAGRNHHIFDPATGRSAHRLLGATVIGPRAMTADGLSTALIVAGEARAMTILAAFPDMRAILTRNDGATIRLGRWSSANA